MMWLEMSRDETHGGPGWAFTECLWSPSHKKNDQGKWPFWESLLRVQEGDTVFHLRGGTHRQQFVGYSIADSDGHETTGRPPQPGEWGYASSYYRVPLCGFVAFADPISLGAVFVDRNIQLREYFRENSEREHHSKERLFYVIQSNRLQCLNGAYCSEVSRDLANILFGIDQIDENPSGVRDSQITVRTGEQLKQMAIRLGQDEFSKEVKDNYGWKCCFPSCSVVESRFLVGAHIARWADSRELRGNVSNGLCLCLMHDKAFEIGLFTLNWKLQVVPNLGKLQENSWGQSNIVPYATRTIALGKIVPARRALEAHWARIQFRPDPIGS